MSSFDERLLHVGQLAGVGQQMPELVHELRQPIFAIKSLAQILRRKIDDEQLEHVDQLLAQVEGLERLIGRYSRSPVDAVQVSAIDLAEVVGDGVEMLRSRARQHGKTLAYTSADTPVAVMADALSVRQITANLVANAIHAATTTVHVQVAGAVGMAQ